MTTPTLSYQKILLILLILLSFKGPEPSPQVNLEAGTVTKSARRHLPAGSNTTRCDHETPDDCVKRLVHERLTELQKRLGLDEVTTIKPFVWCLFGLLLLVILMPVAASLWPRRDVIKPIAEQIAATLVEAAVMVGIAFKLLTYL
jgi:heme exporter protein D